MTWKVEAWPVGAAFKGTVLLLDIHHARLLVGAAVQTLHGRETTFDSAIDEHATCAAS